jgi:hypothetical protein
MIIYREEFAIDQYYYLRGVKLEGEFSATEGAAGHAEGGPSYKKERKEGTS